jgi:hypothetical protein
MILVKVVPDTNMMVAGYEHHTSQCSGCYEVEQRLVFSLRSESHGDENPPAEAAAESSGAAPDAASSEIGGSPPSEPVTNGHAELPAPKPIASAWKRAVERVRIQQADLKERLNGRLQAKLKSDQFNQDSENLASAQARPDGALQATSIEVHNEGGNDAPATPAANGDHGPSATREAAAAQKIDLSQGFDRVWEQLLPSCPAAIAGQGAIDAGEGGGVRPASA